jgi:hypothetical protein
MIWKAVANSGSETGDPHFLDLWFAHAPFSCRTLIAEWIQRERERENELNTTSMVTLVNQKTQPSTDQSGKQKQRKQRYGVHISRNIPNL